VLVGTGFVASPRGVGKSPGKPPPSPPPPREPPSTTSEYSSNDDLESRVVAREAVAMWAAAAVLGPLLDHQHSRFDVLHYADPDVLDFRAMIAAQLATHADVARWAARVSDHAIPNEKIASLLELVFARETGALESAWWVPLLFGGAGVVIGLGHTTLDGIRLTRAAKEDERFIAAASSTTKVRSYTGPHMTALAW
jgi:hypothetical protein